MGVGKTNEPRAVVIWTNISAGLQLFWLEIPIKTKVIRRIRPTFKVTVFNNRWYPSGQTGGTTVCNAAHPHDSAACRTTFSTHNLKSSFSVGCYQSLILLWGNFRPLHFTTLLQFFEVCSIHLSTALLRSHHSISIRSRCGLWLHCNTLVLLYFYILICCCVWDHCSVSWTSFNQALAVRQMASHFTLEGAQVPWLQKTSPNHQPSTTVFDSWYEVFVLICCV